MLGEMRVKQLDLLLTVVPAAKLVGVLFNPENQSNVGEPELAAAARTAGVALHELAIRRPEDLTPAFATMSAQEVGGVIVSREQVFRSHFREIAALAARHRVALIGPPGLPEVGALMSYGTNEAEKWRRVANFVDRILKGANPAELPMEQPTELELVINRKTARTLGLEIPPELAMLATRIIE
jgi:putative ABC transport system substrate-binding protein